MYQKPRKLPLRPVDYLGISKEKAVRFANYVIEGLRFTSVEEQLNASHHLRRDDESKIRATIIGYFMIGVAKEPEDALAQYTVAGHNVVAILDLPPDKAKRFIRLVLNLQEFDGYSSKEIANAILAYYQPLMMPQSHSNEAETSVA